MWNDVELAPEVGADCAPIFGQRGARVYLSTSGREPLGPDGDASFSAAKLRRVSHWRWKLYRSLKPLLPLSAESVFAGKFEQNWIAG